MRFPSLKATSSSPIFFILFYCLSTIALLFFNKWLFTYNPEFNHVLTITWLQQIGVVALLLIFHRLLEPIMGDIALSLTIFRRVSPVGILAAMDYSFSNLALQIIPMTVYEIVKSCAPAVVLVLSILFGLMQPSLKLTMVVILIVSGAIIAVYRPQHSGGDGPIATSMEGLILIIAAAFGTAMKSVAAQMTLHGSKKQLKKQLVRTGAVTPSLTRRDSRVSLTQHGKLSNSFRVSREDLAHTEEGAAPNASFGSVDQDRAAYERYGPVNPITIAFYCGIVMSVALIPVVYIRDRQALITWWNTVDHSVKAKNLGFVWLSSIMSILVSVSSFLVMRETSALTYAIVALGERILIVIMAIILLGEHLPLFNAAGFAITLCGIAWYNQMKSHGPMVAPVPAPATSPTLAVETTEGQEGSALVTNNSINAKIGEADFTDEPFSRRRFDDKRKFSLTSSPSTTLFVPAQSDADTSEDEELEKKANVPTQCYGAVDEEIQAGSPEAEPLRVASAGGRRK